MKLFNTSDANIIRFCQTQFDAHLPSEQLTKRANKFVSKRGMDSNITQLKSSELHMKALFCVIV